MGKDESMTDSYPLLEKVSELIAFLQKEDPDFNEISKFVILRTFNFLPGSAFFGSTLESTGFIKPIGQFGFTQEIMDTWKTTHIDDKLPTADAIRSQNIVWVADSDTWLDDHPDVADHKIDSAAKSFIAWPISIKGAQMSVLGLVINKKMAPTPDLISFFETVGGIIAMQLSKNVSRDDLRNSQNHFYQYDMLTRRQRDIIRLIADGLTNGQIGNELGFSESTIRQETMRIYETFGATGRADAVRMYRKHTLNLI